MNTTQKLSEVGQSIWYDNIERKLLKNGEMARMIQGGEIRGVTSNPTIFMNAITKSSDYDKSMQPMLQYRDGPEDIFFHLAIEDIQAAADLFGPLYDQTKGGDGYVSLEVSPFLAKDTARTLAQAKSLWAQVKRPNLMIKIPATKEGLPAITGAIAEGINVNVTLIFSLARYAEVMEAYLAGLEQRAAKGLPIDKIASVASFFVSRVDTKIDPMLDKLAQSGNAEANGLAGKAAIANAKLAYAQYKNVFGGERFNKKLAALGAKAQRPLWASTGTKNPNYSDVMYVDGLIGPNTVNTVPPATLKAFLDHGQVSQTLEADLPAAQQALDDLAALGIKMDDVTQTLEDEGVKSFSDAFSTLLQAIRNKQA